MTALVGLCFGMAICDRCHAARNVWDPEATPVTWKMVLPGYQVNGADFPSQRPVYPGHRDEPSQPFQQFTFIQYVFRGNDQPSVPASKDDASLRSVSKDEVAAQSTLVGRRAIETSDAMGQFKTTNDADKGIFNRISTAEHRAYVSWKESPTLWLLQVAQMLWTYGKYVLVLPAWKIFQLVYGRVQKRCRQRDFLQKGEQALQFPAYVRDAA